MKGCRGPLSTLKDSIWICNHCGKPYEPKRLNQKYCSKQCGHSFRGEVYPKVHRSCPICSKGFSGPKNQTYCSPDCRREAYNIKKGWKTSRIEWNSLREFIFERDNYTCQDCGKFLMDIGLAAHHIKPLYKGGINDERNLISLCHKCHKGRHSL